MKKLTIPVPEANDWPLLESLYTKLNTKLNLKIEDILERKNVFAFVPAVKRIKNRGDLFVPNLTDDYILLSRLFLNLATYYWEKCPPPVINYFTSKTKRDEFFDDYYEYLSPIFNQNKNDFSRSSLDRYLKQLCNEKLISKTNYSQWLEDYGKDETFYDQTIFGKERPGAASIFPITTYGTFFYEYIINSPTMFHAYLSAYTEPSLKDANKSHNKYNTSVSSLLTTAISIRTKRLSLFANSPFQFDEVTRLLKNKYHYKILHEQSEVLNQADLEAFLRLHSPAFKIAREYRALIEIEDFFKLDTVNFGFNIKNRKMDADDNLSQLFKTKIELDKMLLESIWNNTLKLKDVKIEKVLPPKTI